MQAVQRGKTFPVTDTATIVHNCEKTKNKIKTNKTALAAGSSREAKADSVD